MELLIGLKQTEFETMSIKCMYCPLSFSLHLIIPIL
jgi:hypothetical protein